MNRTKKIAIAAMLTAVGFLLTFINFPLLPQAPFLRYDPGDIAILLLTFLLGPVYGVMSTFIVALLQALLLSADGWFGGLMHFLATSMLLLPAGFLLWRKETPQRRVIGLTVGIFLMVGAMLILNDWLDPIFYGMPKDSVRALLPWIGLFNLFKGGMNVVFSLIVWHSVGAFWKRRKKS